MGLGATGLLTAVAVYMRTYITKSSCIMKVGDTVIEVGKIKEEIENAVKEGVKEEEIAMELKQTLQRLKSSRQNSPV